MKQSNHPKPSLGTRPLFIVLDGLDGIGKTATAKQLTERIGGQYFKMPHSIFEQFTRRGKSFREHVDLLGNVSVRFLFYLMAAAYAKPLIKKLLTSGHVVCDRYLPSTFAYHFAMDPGLRDFDVTALGLLKADYEILLTATEAERRRRISNREQVSSSDWALETDPRFLRRVASEFRSLDMMVVDTTHLSVEETVDCIVDKVSINEVSKGHSHS